MPRVTLFTMLMLMVAACTSYAQHEGTRVGPEFVTGGGEWNTGGGITTVVDLREHNGATVVCGAWTTDRQSALTHGRNREVMAAASVYAGGTRLVHDLGFMTRVPYADNLVGARANCVRTSVPWREEFAETEPRVRIPRIVHAEVADAPGGMGGNVLVFREASRPDIVR